MVQAQVAVVLVEMGRPFLAGSLLGRGGNLTWPAGHAKRIRLRRGGSQDRA
jgi:hypothetical protein